VSGGFFVAEVALICFGWPNFMSNANEIQQIPPAWRRGSEDNLQVSNWLHA
jgi:hypothetical protein